MKSWAIIVGINDYPQLSGQQPLHGAVADACDFADWALDPAGGGVPPERCYFWTYPWPAAASGRLGAYLAGQRPLWDNQDTDWAAPDPARRPSALEIVWTAERVGRAARQLAFEEGDQELRRIYVFLAGHGLRAQEVGSLTEQTCFLAGNFRATSGNTVQGLVPCDSFRKSLLENRFDEALLFLDCCRLETSILAMKATPITDYSTDVASARWGMGHAAQDGQVAYETEGDPVRGAFSKTLVEGLRSCREPGTNSLHVQRLEQYVLANIGAATDKPQQPSFLYNPNPPGPVIVTGPPTGTAGVQQGRAVDLSALPPGTQVVLKDGNNVPVQGIAPLLAGPDPVQLPPLPDGLYALEVQGQADRFTLFKQPGAGTVNVG